jgi:hypothetical protein
MAVLGTRRHQIIGFGTAGDAGPALTRRAARALGLAAVALAVMLSPSTAMAAPPRNDNYLSSFRILNADGSFPTGWHDTEDTTQATTQSDVFSVDPQGNPLGGGPPEPTTCGSTSFGNTVWYDYAPPVDGGVELAVSGFATAVTVYEYNPRDSSITREVACSVGLGLSQDFTLPHDARARRFYTVQVGGVSSQGVIATGALEFTFAFYPDRDGDEVLDATPDKCPTRPGISRYGGCPPTLEPAPSYGFAGLPTGVRLKRLVVSHVPSGARVQARCRRCDLHQVVKVQAGTHTARMTRFVGPVLPAGSSLEIWVTRGRTKSGVYHYGAFGRYFRYPIRAGAVGARIDRCLLPGSVVPRRRCR